MTPRIMDRKTFKGNNFNRFLTAHVNGDQDKKKKKKRKEHSFNLSIAIDWLIR